MSNYIYRKGFIMQTPVKLYKIAALLIVLILFAALLPHNPSLLITSTPSGGQYISDPIYINIGNVSIVLETVGNIRTLAADSDNQLLLKARAVDEHGRGVPHVAVSYEISEVTSEDSADTPVLKHDHDTGIQSKELGTMEFSSGMTGAAGNHFNIYTPPDAAGTKQIKITAYIDDREKSSSTVISLIPVPVVLVHGYQADHKIFSGLSEYLSSNGFITMSIDYDSQAGIKPAALELSEYLDRKKAELSSDGFQTSRFDLIAHSMGGLVARYYTSSNDYALRGDIRKIIFLSVPHKGSYFASLGQNYFSDDSIRDMSEGSELFTDIFPSLINKGLNPSIQTAAILGRYDEVVSPESASLSEWGIKTEIFDVGESNLTVEKLLSGELLNAANHKLILYNSLVFNRIRNMLEQVLPFPSGE